MGAQKVPTGARHVPTNVRHTLRQDFIKQRKEAQRKDDQTKVSTEAQEPTEGGEAAQLQGQANLPKAGKLRQEGPVQEVRREDASQTQAGEKSAQSALETLNSFVAPFQDRARSFFSSLRESLFGGRNSSTSKADSDTQIQGTRSQPALHEIQKKDPWGTRTNGLGAAVHREAAGVSTTLQARPRPLRDAGIFADRLLEATDATELPRISLTEESAIQEAQTVETKRSARTAPERVPQEPRSVFSQQVSYVSETAPVEDKPMDEPMWGDDLPRVGL
ncbi:MAG: hypothetical protein H6727_16220 [Myxococcales bacterium]|nr:hypothetical protein [Myxococcales bacterium]